MTGPADQGVGLSRLPELIGLAEEGSSEKRRALLRELTGHFFGMTSFSLIR